MRTEIEVCTRIRKRIKQTFELWNANEDQSACEQKGHSDEQIIAVCMKKECQFSSRLMCLSCLTSEHCDHGRYSMKITDFLGGRSGIDLIKSWKGDSELASRMIKGLREYSKRVNILEMTEQIDNFQHSIQMEIDSFRKQILSDVYSKRMEGDKECEVIVETISHLLGIDKLIQLFQDYSQESPVSNAEIDGQVKAIVKEQSDEKRTIYAKCLEKIASSPCVYSYHIDTEVLKQVGENITSCIRQLFTSMQKVSHFYYLQAAQAYDSFDSIDILEQGSVISFRNTSTYAVAYLTAPIAVDKPLRFNFMLTQPLLNKHLCIGLRRDSQKDEDSYNKTPYKCLHCVNGDGIIMDNSLHMHLKAAAYIFEVLIDPIKRELSIFLNKQSQPHLSLSFPPREPQQTQDPPQRLYFWRVPQQTATQLRIIHNQQ